MLSSLVLHNRRELTAAQILHAGKLNAQLVALSACNTGLNRLAYGDELLGLTRAFIGAGTQSLVVSLWRVYETPTRLFMDAFYRAWRGGQTKAKALLQAQHYLRQLSPAKVFEALMQLGLSDAAAQQQVNFFIAMSGPAHAPFDHPCYWGAFLLIGDPR